MSETRQSITVNGRSYRRPKQPLVIVCIDGSQPDYIIEAVAAGCMPWSKSIIESIGSDLRGDCVVPSFTNPNNMSIVTGVAPNVHGICGNFYYDKEHDIEVMMNEPSLLRTPTIFKAFQQAGAKVAIITAKDKLRRLLGNDLLFGKSGAICFSAEKAGAATLAENGIANALDLTCMQAPSVYSAELSEFIFKAGVKLMQSVRPDVMYLSTTDYIQHKFAPGSEGANNFYQMMDRYWETLHKLGAIIGLTADHGMNAKHNDAGEPNVIYLQDTVDRLLGAGKGRVILPITDPYVAHHGALGSFATVYLEPGIDVDSTLQSLSQIDGIECVLNNADACDKFLLAADRIGDIVLVSKIDTVIGTSADRHDLSGLDVPLRSHGGISEQTVPLIFNRKITGIAGRSLKNFDVFDLACNHAT